MMKERKLVTETTETGNNNRTETRNNDTWLSNASKQVNYSARVLFKQ